MPQGVGYTTMTGQNSGGTNSRNGNGRASGNVAGVQLGIKWPTERWVGLIVLVALGLLILIRFGFRGLGFQGNIGARVST